jgi:D-inositol-3-phosphate glycosyltransferase
MHTSPLAQPGTGDGGGMNVYVRELSSALARAGVACDVFTRASSSSLPATVEVEPGLVVHHISAGPPTDVPKNELYSYTGAFADGVEQRLEVLSAAGFPTDAIHANYWLSGIAGHSLKHRLDLPLVSTFHTLDRVKAEASPDEIDPLDPDRRARSEAEIIGCSDAVLASCSTEVDQLVDLYGAVRDRVEIIAPGVDHAFFSPGDKAQARRALQLEFDVPLLLFVGRIQPLKGADVAIRTLHALARFNLDASRLLIVGGPSGPSGGTELDALRRLTVELALSDRVQFAPPQPHELLSTFYRAADCCIVPSRAESFGLVALEAGACGTPVVASAVGGLSSLIESGRTGYLIESRDPMAFARHVARVISEPRLARELGANAAERARSYTWSIAAARLRRLYFELTARSLVECR